MALTIFALTYLFIAGGRLPFTRLDRPSGALVGAVLMVASRTVTIDEVYRRAIDFNTIVLLLGMMLITGFLSESGFFAWASDRALRLARTPRGLLVSLCAASGLLSAFLVNDTVCLMFTPLALRVVLDAELPPLPYLLAVAMGANSGSAATLTGNPQNMLIGQMSHLAYARFALAVGPAALVANLTTAVLLLWLFRKELPRKSFEVNRAPPALDRLLLGECSLALLVVVGCFFAGLPMAWTTLGGAAAMFVVANCEPRRIFGHVDYVLLVFFAGLFVVVYAIDQAGYAERMLAWAQPFFGTRFGRQVSTFSVLTIFGSNVFSNVPFVLLAGHLVNGLSKPATMWSVLALVSTLAGNLTVVGSVANIIVLEMARDRVRVGFWQYLRYGVPVTLISVVLGVLVLLATTSVFPPG